MGYIIIILAFIFSINLSYADGIDTYYDLNSNVIRDPESPARIAAAPYIESPATIQNAIIKDKVYNFSRGRYEFRLLFSDAVNDVVNTTYFADLDLGSYYELEVSPLGKNGVWISPDSQYIRFTKDSGATWINLTLPTSTTHKTLLEFHSYGSVEIATFDKNGNLVIFYHTLNDPFSPTTVEANRAIYDTNAILLSHTVLAKQNYRTDLNFINNVISSYDRTFAILRPAHSWKASDGTLHDTIPEVLVYDENNNLVESTHIGTLPSEPNADDYNKLMRNTFSNILTTDGHALYTLTNSIKHTDSFGPVEDNDIRRFAYDPVDGFFPDHGSPQLHDPLTDLKQLSSFKTHTFMSRTLTDDWTGSINFMAAKWDATTPDLSVDIVFTTADDIELLAQNGKPLEFQVARVVDPGSTGQTHTVDLSRNDIDCDPLRFRKNPVYCSILSGTGNASFLGIEGSVLSTFNQFLYASRNDYSITLYTIDLSS